MGSGDIVVGNTTSKSDQFRLKKSAESAGEPASSAPRQQQMCGAMSQQGDDHHTSSQPQEFVRLVGYRNPKGRSPS